MPPFGPISRTNLIRGLRALGFAGPYPGGRHAYMVRGEQRVALPNPHQGDIGVSLLARYGERSRDHATERRGSDCA